MKSLALLTPGTLTIGTRTGSPPFAYVNSKNEWVGFSIDLVEQLVLDHLHAGEEGREGRGARMLNTASMSP